MMRSEVIIDLKKLNHNVEVIKSALKPSTKVMAVIKDNAYGHGAKELAKHLTEKVEWFCVATVKEGIELRKTGIENPILIFEPVVKSHSTKYVDYSLTASISDVEHFDELGVGSDYHINFDTGMRRLGIPIDQTPEALSLMKTHQEINCTGIYTHFASADEPGSKSVNEQLELFKSIKNQFTNELMVHIANTGGIFHYQDLDTNFDAVRPGVCLYGYAAGDTEIEQLSPILSWKSKISQVRSIKKGESVGYGESWIAPEDGIVGTVPVGYGDGLMRVLSGKIKVLVNGALIQQVGRISMDYFGIYTPDKKSFITGDKVLLLNGKELDAKLWAEIANTIPYEITSLISKKRKRKYLN